MQCFLASSAFVWVAFLSFAAFADTIHETEITGSTTFHGSLDFQQFDPSQGQLNRITLSVFTVDSPSTLIHNSGGSRSFQATASGILS